MAASNFVSLDIKDLLVSKGIGAFGGSADWAIFIGKEPPDPDSCITIYDTLGEAPNPKWLLDEPRFQVRFRSNDYPAMMAKADAVKRALLGLPSQTLGGTVYVGIWMIADTGFLMQDANERSIVTQSYRVIREPNTVSGDNRRPL